MSKLKFTETTLQQTLHSSEDNLDSDTLDSLAEARGTALSSQNKWFNEYRGVFSAGLVTAVLMFAVFLPVSENERPGASPSVDIADENLQLMMEDPEFFLWVSGSYSSLSR